LHPNRQSRSRCFRNSARASADSLSQAAESSGPAPQALRLESASNRSPRFAVLLSRKWRRREVMLLSGRRPPDPLQTGAGALASFTSKSPRGRICTCVDPLRRRRPELLGHAEMEHGRAPTAPSGQSEGEPSGCPQAGSPADTVDLAAGLPPTTRRSKRRMIIISPREENGPPARNCTWTSTFARSRDRSFTTGR
jgi:hypothetical protein